MSWKHPRPWTAFREAAERKNGKVTREYWAVIDARKCYIVAGLDKDTALEIADTVKERDEI